MKFVYIGKGMEVTDSLKARVEKKLTKLERYFQDDVEAQIRISQERGNRNIVEITISVGSVILRAEEVSNDMYMSIDRAVDKLNRQIRRHRTKLEKRLRAGAFEPVANEPAEPEEEAAHYDLVRVKKFPSQAHARGRRHRPDGAAWPHVLPLYERGDGQHVRPLPAFGRKLRPVCSRNNARRVPPI